MASEKLKGLVGQTIQRVEIDGDVVFIKTPDSVFVLKPSEENQSLYAVFFEEAPEINLNIDLLKNKVKDAQFCFGLNPQLHSVIVDISLTNRGEIVLTWLFKPLKNIPLPMPTILLQQYESYRPSNSTEGDGFINCHCAKCAHYTGRCEFDIDAVTMLFQTEDKEYPVEWLRTEQGERFCWKFLPANQH